MNELKLEQGPVIKNLNIMEIDKEFNIINPTDVYRFINDKKGFVDLINKTKGMIKDFSQTLNCIWNMWKIVKMKN